MNRFDNDLQKAIMKKTVSTTDHKDDIWKNIKNELEVNSMKKVKSNSKLRFIAACLIVVIIAAMAFTPPGRAAVSKIIDLFEKEKIVDTEVEGEVETTDQQLQVGTTPIPEPEATSVPNLMTYVMYIDEASYDFESADGVDRITPKDYPDTLPEVYMEIKQILDVSKEDVLSELIEEVHNDYDTVLDVEEVNEPFYAVKIIAYDGDPNGTKDTMPQWDSDIVKYLLVDNTQGGTFIIKMKFFIEAEEGHGSRFTSMLNEFTIVPAE